MSDCPVTVCVPVVTTSAVVKVPVDVVLAKSCIVPVPFASNSRLAFEAFVLIMLLSIETVSILIAPVIVAALIVGFVNTLLVSVCEPVSESW